MKWHLFCLILGNYEEQDKRHAIKVASVFTHSYVFCWDASQSATDGFSAVKITDMPFLAQHQCDAYSGGKASYSLRTRKHDMQVGDQYGSREFSVFCKVERGKFTCHVPYFELGNDKSHPQARRMLRCKWTSTC